MAKRILYKTDKNGTKYYHNVGPCYKCGGTGIISYFVPINGGDCYACGGSGIEEWDDKEYTPEYEAKLEAQRAKKEAKRMAKLQAELPAKQAVWLEKNGLNSEKVTYIFLGNTYEIKDQLKAIGAKFDYILGWHIDHEVEDYQTMKVDLSECLMTNMFDGYNFDNEKLFALDLDSLRKVNYNKINNIKGSEYVGNIKDKLEIEVTLKFWVNFETMYGAQTLYSFTDDQGNIIVWKTANWLDLEKETKVILKGTVKDHNEYKGEKQTVLTRCKVEVIK